MKNKKHVRDWIVITNALLIMGIVLLFTNIPVSPIDNYKTTAREVTFEVLGAANSIMLDDNEKFTSPVIIQRPFKILLEPGAYFWKAGLSKVNTFTIESAVVVATKDDGEDVKVKNVGNVELSLDIREGSLLTGRAILGVGESLRTKDEGKITAEQNE